MAGPAGRWRQARAGRPAQPGRLTIRLPPRRSGERQWPPAGSPIAVPGLPLPRRARDLPRYRQHTASTPEVDMVKSARPREAAAREERNDHDHQPAGRHGRRASQRRRGQNKHAATQDHHPRQRGGVGSPRRRRRIRGHRFEPIGGADGTRHGPAAHRHGHRHHDPQPDHRGGHRRLHRSPVPPRRGHRLSSRRSWRLPGGASTGTARRRRRGTGRSWAASSAAGGCGQDSD